jgi:predicted ATPase/DNA-binding SARP family transcriptional activator
MLVVPAVPPPCAEKAPPPRGETLPPPRGETLPPPRGEVDPPADPLRTSPLTPLVGRDAEIAALLTLVRGTRLVSLVGPGGSGKTRLAGAVAERLAGDRHRTWWVPLAQLDRPGTVIAAVADALGVAETPARRLSDAVAAHLRDHPGLLVLDNCEHLVAACAALVGDLLRACPQLRVLTTSREPLAVAGETTWWVQGLSLPPDRPAPTAAELAGSEAVRLFADRARLIRPGFAVTDANAADLTRLCRRLDGMPLALELAAARLRMLPLPRIVARLDDAVSLLMTTNRDVPARQATLRATLDWSHGLLPEPERDLFARLSVFRGEFTLSAAEAVAAVGDGTPVTLDLLTRLVDKSLVQACTDGAEERYRLLEVVRQYAADSLGERHPTAAALHAGYMRDLAGRAEAGLGGAEQRVWLDRLHRDRDNLRAALTWTRRADPGLDVELAAALGHYWRLSGQYAEGRQWLHAAVSDADRRTPPATLAKALTALGTLEFLLCEYAAADARLRRARDLYATAGDERGLALTVHRLGGIAREQGRYAEAWAHHRECQHLWQRLGDPSGVARALKGMGFTAWLQGDHTRAVGFSTEALRRFRELDDAEGAVGALIDLAAATFRGGDPATAEELLAESLAVAGPRLREAYGWANEQLGLIAAARGDRARAVALLRQSLSAHHELGDRWRMAGVLDALAGLCADGRAGARLLAAADRQRQEIGTPVPPCDLADHRRRVHAVHAGLSRAELDRVTLQGVTLTLDEAVAAAAREPAELAAVRQPAVSARPAELTVRALGRSVVTVGDRELSAEDWTYAKPRELLHHMLIRPGGTKAEIGLDLWPEASGTELRNSFHTCLKFLRQALGPAARVRFAAGAYHLEPLGPLHYDVADFRAAGATAREQAGTPAAIGALTEAAGRYAGDFLTQVPVGGWAEPYRDDLRREYEHVLRDLGAVLGRERRFVEAADVFARLVTHDPLLETAHRGIMRCHAALGDRARALRHYDDLSRLLDARIGAPPAPETTQLYLKIRDRPAA